MDLQNPSQSLSSPPPPPPPPPPPQQQQQPPLKKPKMSTTTTSDSDTTTTTTNPRRYKRRKLAIFFAYCGVGYQGMQKNPGAKTIEGDLEEALYFSGAIPDVDRGQHKKYDWARSARTDKGVSAVGQVVSGRFYIDPDPSGFIQRLNFNLNPQIRVFGYKRVTPSFNAKKFCDRRRYVYLLPVFALDCTRHRDRESVLASFGSGDGELVRCFECSERGRKVFGVMGNRSCRGNVEKKSVIDDDHDDVSLVKNDVKDVELDGVVRCGENVNGNGDGDGFVEVGVMSKNGDGDVSLISECNVVEKSLIDDDDAFVKNEGVLLANDVKEVESEGVVRCGENVNGNGDGFVELGVTSKNGDGDVSLISECNVVNKPLIDDDTFVASDVKEAELEGVVHHGESGEGNVGEEVKAKKSEFKYGEEEKKRFNRILKYYEGTHNFHNFTTRTKAEDPSAKRYIVSFEANTTLNIEGIEFVKCEVIGQSFMLHQIRKMIGMAVAVMRNFVPESIYERAFDQEFHINVPTAPEVGLYLDECLFTSYNNKWKDTHEEISMKDYIEEAEEFKLKYIYSHIAKTEHKEGSVAVWLHSLNHRNYPDFRPLSDNEVERAVNEVECVGNEVGRVVEDGLEKSTDDGLETASNDQGERGVEGEGVAMDVLP